MKWPRRYHPHVSILYQVTGLAFGLIGNILLARLLGAGGYGEYSLVLTLITIMAVPLEVGLVNVTIRNISGLTSESNEVERNAITSKAHTLLLLYSIPCLILLVTLITYSGDYSRGYKETLLCGAILLPIGALVMLRSSILRGLGYPLFGQLYAMVFRPCLFFLLLCFTYYGNPKAVEWPSWKAMGLYVVATGVTLLLILWFPPKNQPSISAIIEPRSISKIWLKGVLGFSIMAVAVASNQALGSMLIAYFYNPVDVGIYRVAELGASLVTMPISSLTIFYSADIANRIKNNDGVGLRMILRSAARLSFALALTITAIFITFGDFLIFTFFGDKYINALTPLIILSLAQLGFTSAGLAGGVMTMGGRYKDVLEAVLIALVVQALLAAILLPQWGIIGAAVASFVGTIVWSQILRHRVKMNYKVSCLPI